MSAWRVSRTAQPTTLRVNMSMSAARNSQPSSVRMQVRSASQTWFGAVAVKLRRSLFGGREDQKTIRWIVFPRGG
jgi:hypothetical protein